MDRYDRLERIKRLLDEGVLTPEEYDREKSRILSEEERTSWRDRFEPGLRPWNMDVADYCMFLHLSQALLLFPPGVGILVPIVMWAMFRDRDPRIDAHGRVVLNWSISFLLYWAIAVGLMFVLIGFVVVAALVVVHIVFLVLGAIRASRGELWRYPLSIPFLAVPPDAGSPSPPEPLP